MTTGLSDKQLQDAYCVAGDRWPEMSKGLRAVADLAITHLEAELHGNRVELRAILDDLIDPDGCQWDHNHSCQAHGYYYIPQGEKCPNEKAKDYLATLE